MEPKTRLDRDRSARADADAWRRGARFTEEFHMRRSPVHRALARLTHRLDEAAIPYAIAGAMALNGHGYFRATVDIDVLITAAGLQRFHAEWLGRGYVQVFDGSRGVRDTEDGVPIDFLVSDEFPGDGLAKDVCFPDPAGAAEVIDGTRVVTLACLIELKLASGLSARHRLRDLADVLELIRLRGLPESLADDLAPSVRAKYRELWAAARSAPPDAPA